MTHNLSDIRGYDAVDSKYITSLLTAVQDSSVKSPRYAATQWYLPQLFQRGDGTIYLPPVLSMLNTRYLIFRSEPAVNWRVVFQEDDYWVIENPDFLPRVFIPSSVRRADTDEQTLRRMAQPTFNPKARAFVHSVESLPADGMEGEAEIIRETPGHIVVRANMKTPGMVVLSDSWHPGWSASVNDHPAEVLRTNVAICSVLVPAGEHNIVMTYRPTSLPPALFAAVCGMAIALVPFFGFRSTSHRDQETESSERVF